jgi:hypothetical protein
VCTTHVAEQKPIHIPIYRAASSTMDKFSRASQSSFYKSECIVVKAKRSITKKLGNELSIVLPVDDCVPRLFCLFSLGTQLWAGREIKLSARVGFGSIRTWRRVRMRTTRGNNWLEKFLVFLPVFVYRARSLVCAGNELLASEPLQGAGCISPDWYCN